MISSMESGLQISTLKKYARSPLLERAEDGTAVYMHRDAWHPCDYACNGVHGEKIANDINVLEGDSRRDQK